MKAARSFPLFAGRPLVPAQALARSVGNRWDWALLPLVLAVLVALAWGASQMARPYQVGQPIPLSLDPWMLPWYLLRTTLRMFLALGASLLFSCLFAVAAVRWRMAERALVPLLDILQSIPILGFLFSRQGKSEEVLHKMAIVKATVTDLHPE